MPGAPRAASASPSEPVLPGRQVWDKRQRLLRAPEFAAFSQTPPSVRAARRWIAMSALIHPAEIPHADGAQPGAAVRFGFTISKRQARRAVARNAVRRVLREAARRAAPRLELAARPRQIDVLFRLKQPLPLAGQVSWASVKQQLRQEADSLIDQLDGQLRAPARRQAQSASVEPGALP